MVVVLQLFPFDFMFSIFLYVVCWLFLASSQQLLFKKKENTLFAGHSSLLAKTHRLNTFIFRFTWKVLV